MKWSNRVDLRLSTRFCISLATSAVCLSSRLARAVSSSVCATAMAVTCPIQHCTDLVMHIKNESPLIHIMHDQISTLLQIHAEIEQKTMQKIQELASPLC